MANVYLIYSNNRLPLSPLIRWRTGSKFSHVGLILEENEESVKWDSLVTHSALSCKGVRFTTVKTFVSHASDYQVTKLDKTITKEQFHLLYNLAKSYEGLPYDTKGAIGLGVDEDWQEDDAFWCSEWVAFLLIRIGMDLPYLNDIHRIAPKHNLAWPQQNINIMAG